MRSEIQRIVLVTHGDPAVACESVRQCLEYLRERSVTVLAPLSEWEKHGEVLRATPGVDRVARPEDLEGVGLCLVLGGDGTMLRAFHLTRDRCIPVAGVNFGRVGFLTTVSKDDLAQGLERLLAGEFREYPLLGLEASIGGHVYRATNDVVVGRGGSPHACSVGLTINGVTLFEVMCDGVVVGTPAGSSAYSLAAGGPLLGISVEAYVISLVAPHAVGVRPVIAAPQDVLDITNLDEKNESCLDIDGQRVGTLPPGGVVRIKTSPAMTSLALLEGDSLYHHFRDRLL